MPQLGHNLDNWGFSFPKCSCLVIVQASLYTTIVNLKLNSYLWLVNPNTRFGLLLISADGYMDNIQCILSRLLWDMTL